MPDRVSGDHVGVRVLQVAQPVTSWLRKCQCVFQWGRGAAGEQVFHPLAPRYVCLRGSVINGVWVVRREWSSGSPLCCVCLMQGAVQR